MTGIPRRGRKQTIRRSGAATTTGAPARRVQATGRRALDDGPDRPPIRTRGLTKTYGELVAVDHLDLEVRRGEIFGLLGQNGAGKTTTILMLLGLTEPTEGEARVVGLDPARRPLEVKRRVGYLPDSVGFYSGMTGRENLRFTGQLNGLSGADAERTIDEVLEQVGLSARADSPTGTYSRGMLQRLGIADALVKDPDVLILDEPTAAIDPLGVVEILDLLRALVNEREMSILLSSHLLTQVQSVCDRVGIFAAGRLVGVGTVDELAHRFGDERAQVEVGLELTDDADAGRAEAALAAVSNVVGVKRAARAGDPWVVTVEPVEAATGVRQAILATAVSSGLHLTSLRAVVPSLDDIYRTAVMRRGGSGRVAA
jgi:ABC-2 type transport system ATP-binding protein